ncbi:MAG TPA: LemA family protein [Candidatus Avirikenella pullistercoris]|nr:LemA family protein [Candidatus Avirikenella pullistercoris]
MKRSKIVGIIVLGVVVILAITCYSFFKNNYNSMVAMQESVVSAWSNVENQYQRRSDLIPNLVNTVKGYATHEQTTLTDVIDARAKATQIKLNVENLTEESLQRYNQVQGELSSALSRLMVVSEQYPDLKANQNFADLQAQLEGTENRIATERRKFNETVQNYNSFIRMFPRNIVANMFGFEAKAYFEAAEGTEQAPKVEF